MHLSYPHSNDESIKLTRWLTHTNSFAKHMQNHLRRHFLIRRNNYGSLFGVSQFTTECLNLQRKLAIISSMLVWFTTNQTNRMRRSIVQYIKWNGALLSPLSNDLVIIVNRTNVCARIERNKTIQSQTKTYWQHVSFDILDANTCANHSVYWIRFQW